jgi:hypothetical protein
MEIMRPEDRFAQVPLLDAFTLGILITKMESNLNAFGKY